MSEQLVKQMDEAEQKRRKQEFYLNVRDCSIGVILVSWVVFLIYYVAMRGGYAS